MLRDSIFGDAAPSVVAAVAVHLQPVWYRQRRRVFSEGDTGDCLYIIGAGKVKVSRTSGGQDRAISLLGPGEVFGELAVYDPGPRASTVATLTEVQALILTADALRSCIADHPEITVQLFRLLADRLRRTNDVVCDQVFTDAPGRVAATLLDLARRFGSPHNGVMRVAHGLSTSELGQLAGTSRESMSKALSAFADRGWVRQHSKVIDICDPAALAQRGSKLHGPARSGLRGAGCR
ncbi:Crp/Fnr family transcriptional regulator [Mycobacterium sp. PDNC021]|uniref:Crp/Fnr family transcriptional regulator n=1 Tax=Mycobacterium sp. PDNC021 TaxID=3391399 RepID=UPI003AAB0CE3